MTIGRLAKLAHINVETIRFYQKRGLCEIPEKPAHGYHIYSSDALSTLFFIQRAKQVGFTLAEIKKQLALDENKNCSTARQMAQEKLSLVNDKLDDL